MKHFIQDCKSPGQDMNANAIFKLLALSAMSRHFVVRMTADLQRKGKSINVEFTYTQT
jgi:hypothetical protein